MQTVSLKMRPVSGPFEVPFSTGYQTYSGLLSVIDDVGDGVADDLHDAPFAGLSNSGLLGQFAHGADRDHHRMVQRDENIRYTLHLGVTHPDDREVFEALVRAFVIQDRNLPLAHGELTVEEVSTDRMTPQELLSSSADAAKEARGVRMRFRSPTCRQRYDNVWETHPHRVHLFQHLADRWNAVVNDESLEITPTEQALGTDVYAQLDCSAYGTHSIVVHRRDPETGTTTPPAATDGGHLNEVQGFTGEWTFKFKGASEATRAAVVTLARFAEFSGVGRHNARGAGSVATRLDGVER